MTAPRQNCSQCSTLWWLMMMKIVVLLTRFQYTHALGRHYPKLQMRAETEILACLATLLHIWWLCIKVSPFWKLIFLHCWRNNKSLFPILWKDLSLRTKADRILPSNLLVAVKLIALNWRSQTVPGKVEWLQTVQYVLLTNKLTAINKFIAGDYQAMDKFLKVWDKSIKYWD